MSDPVIACIEHHPDYDNVQCKGDDGHINDHYGWSKAECRMLSWPSEAANRVVQRAGESPQQHAAFIAGIAANATHRIDDERREAVESVQLDGDQVDDDFEPYITQPTGAQLRDEAMARVDENANPEWKERVHQVIQQIALRQPSLTTDDIWMIMDNDYPMDVTHERRAIGPAMNRAVKEEFIKLRTCDVCHTNKVSVSSVRPVSHKMDIYIYDSLIYRE